MTTVVIIFQMLILAACLRSYQRRNTPSKEQPARQLAFTEMNYPEWDEFWKKFKLAVRQKDNSRILGLINFPFIQNAKNIGDVEFLKRWSSQLDNIENATEPVEAYGVEDMFPMESIRHTNFNETDFYFARENGYYKLVAIITTE